MQPLAIFSAYGIELEYMIVDRDNLDLLHVSDEILKSVAGEYINEVEQGEIAWSNEVVLHVIELKTNGPVKNFQGLPTLFSKNLNKINTILDQHNGKLMPTAMHPWMRPYRETRLWPHGSSDIYDTYNRIFNCQGHGWSNLQSMHINLPFADDHEFAQLHTAIRLLLPVMPAIAASSPVMEGELTGMMDTRLETYRKNADIIPSITGMVVPEPVTSKAEYLKTILHPMYKDISPHDPDKILQDEWLNSRGAIARFDRNAIEIRVLDTQETPLADLAIASIIIAALKKIITYDWSDQSSQLKISTPELAQILLATIKNAEQTIIDNKKFLSLFAFPDRQCSAQEFWQYLYESVDHDEIDDHAELDRAIRFIIKNGPLARRILNPLQKGFRHPKLSEVYRVLTDCLDQGKLFEGI
ncbi:MAG: carboxylate-amine ligase [Gammaproteobacteria bacterium]|jgi:carboxylate-amine ligase